MAPFNTIKRYSIDDTEPKVTRLYSNKWTN